MAFPPSSQLVLPPPAAARPGAPSPPKTPAVPATADRQIRNRVMDSMRTAMQAKLKHDPTKGPPTYQCLKQAYHTTVQDREALKQNELSKENETLLEKVVALKEQRYYEEELRKLQSSHATAIRKQQEEHDRQLQLAQAAFDAELGRKRSNLEAKLQQEQQKHKEESESELSRLTGERSRTLETVKTRENEIQALKSERDALASMLNDPNSTFRTPQQEEQLVNLFTKMEISITNLHGEVLLLDREVERLTLFARAHHLEPHANRADTW